MTVQRRLELEQEPIRYPPQLAAYKEDPDGWRAAWAERRRLEDERRARMTPIWQADAERLKHCPMKAPNAGEPGRCGLCGEELPRTSTGRIHPNRRWCSQACSDTYWNNHGWDAASHAAVRRDGWRCRRCNHPGSGRSSPPLGTFDPDEVAAAGGLRALEVNHRRPRNGRGYHEGCHHHLEELETLCRPCHAGETQKQIRARRLARGLRILIGIRTGELTVQYHRLRVERASEAVPEPIWEDP